MILFFIKLNYTKIVIFEFKYFNLYVMHYFNPPQPEFDPEEAQFVSTKVS